MRESKSTSAGARRLRDQLAHLGVVPLGLVMNGTTPVEDRAAYGYYAYIGDPRSGRRRRARGGRVRRLAGRRSSRLRRARERGSES